MQCKVNVHAHLDRKYGELLQLFAECGENWAECTISSTTSTDDQRSVQGGQCYKRYKDLLAEHGKENAERLRAEKKAKQSALGDAYENVPWWYAHPDFADLEETRLSYTYTFYLGLWGFGV